MTVLDSFVARTSVAALALATTCVRALLADRSTTTTRQLREDFTAATVARPAGLDDGISIGTRLKREEMIAPRLVTFLTRSVLTRARPAAAAARPGAGQCGEAGRSGDTRGTT
ncbi:hypothetical protein [Jannaschia formosa]|uniref:hypothetical protein n=1 Tax=Jannaschia formosa TaxID=2259592 RepID=UPI001075692C|nr:hypothetical protein [Jannaschia formosa]TFL19531.1 hypothetical protein DR046_03215 [Jannaschia formosa]